MTTPEDDDDAYERSLLWRHLPAVLVMLCLSSLFVGYAVSTFVGWLVRA